MKIKYKKVYMWFTRFTRGLFNILLQCKPCKPVKIMLKLLNNKKLIQKSPEKWFTCCKPFKILIYNYLTSFGLQGLQGLHFFETIFATKIKRDE